MKPLASRSVSILEEKILKAVEETRPLILDPVELVVGEGVNWKFLRTRLLKELGDRGLVGRVKRIFDEEHKKQGESFL